MSLRRWSSETVPLIRRRALVLGDGDGRFLAYLLARNPRLHADAVDLSPAMLRLLRLRAEAATPTAASRLATHTADALAFHPSASCDLVVTHFFLDCLTQPELDILVARTVPHLEPGALWLLSDFRIPPGSLRLPASILIRTLYLAFRLLTGLRAAHLPDHASPLHLAGLFLVARHRSLLGILTTELWQHHPSHPLRHPTARALPQEISVTTPSPVPAIPPTPGTDLPSGPTSPSYDPIPGPESPSPSLPESDPGPFQE